LPGEALVGTPGKLPLGTHPLAPGLLGESAYPQDERASEQSRSFALKWVPKLEFGNQKEKCKAGALAGAGTAEGGGSTFSFFVVAVRS